MMSALRETVREVAKAVAIAALSELAIEVTLDVYERLSGKKTKRRQQDEGSNNSFEPTRDLGSKP